MFRKKSMPRMMGVICMIQIIQTIILVGFVHCMSQKHKESQRKILSALSK